MLSGIPIPKDAVRPPETVLVNITPQETRVAVLEENNICELHIERNSGHSLVGNIYLGVVRRVLPGMQSAFIDIGLERAAFLHIVDVLEQRRNPDETQRIEHMLFEGQSVLVQVIKDPINTKGARLSTQISLAGRFLVHLPQEDHIGISQRIEDDAERNSLRERLTNLLPEDQRRKRHRRAAFVRHPLPDQSVGTHPRTGENPAAGNPAVSGFAFEPARVARYVQPRHAENPG